MNTGNLIIFRLCVCVSTPQSTCTQCTLLFCCVGVCVFLLFVLCFCLFLSFLCVANKFVLVEHVIMCYVHCV